jgi:predicted permease
MLLNFTVGISCSRRQGQTESELFINPPLVAGLITVLLFAVRVPMPAVVVDTVTLFSG